MKKEQDFTHATAGPLNNHATATQILYVWNIWLSMPFANYVHVQLSPFMDLNFCSTMTFHVVHRWKRLIEDTILCS